MGKIKAITIALAIVLLSACGVKEQEISAESFATQYYFEKDILYYMGSDEEHHHFAEMADRDKIRKRYKVKTGELEGTGWFAYSKTNGPRPFRLESDIITNTVTVTVMSDEGSPASGEAPGGNAGEYEGYEGFISHFPPMTIGKKHTGDGFLLPNEGLASAFYYMGDEEIEAGGWEELYAIGMINDYRGYDILIMEYISERADEDSYDNHGGAYRFAVFHNGDDFLRNNDDEILVRTLESTYYGEGGEAETTSWFDRDIMVISREWASESESATGYQTPLISERIYRWEILSGRGSQDDVISIEFSSPFYDLDFIAANSESWRSNDFRNYPREDDRWPLDLEPFSTTYVTFFIEDTDNDLTPVFESREPQSGKVIEKYIVGSISELPIYTDNSPVRIRTSEGIVQVFADGRFGNPIINVK